MPSPTWTAASPKPNGQVIAQSRYSAFGQVRLEDGSLPTDQTYTGQRDDGYINLLDYGSRQYDPELGRFIQPDSIIPSVGEGNNPNTVGYVPGSNYSPLVVDYHENQFLGQLNQENRERLENPQAKLPSVPINPLAFDRYAYTFNNPIRYNDPTGHCPLCFVAVIGGAQVTIGTAEVLLITGVTIWAIDSMMPDAQTRHIAFAHSIVDLGEQASQGIQTLFAKKPDVKYGDYLADKYGLERPQRRKLHDEITRQGLTKEEIEAQAAEMARLNKQKQQPNQDDNDK